MTFFSIAGYDAPVTICPDQSYCCGANNNTCCIAKQGVFIRTTSDGGFTISSSAKTNNNGCLGNDGLSCSALYATAIGVPLGVIIPLIGIICEVIRRRRANQVPKQPEPAPA